MKHKALRSALTFLIPLASALLLQKEASAQQKPWHGIERQLHYKPEGQDFVLVNGKKRFNRALYGTNTGFRVETGDLPEFALYMPGMGGNLKFGLISGNKSIWLIDAKEIETRYRPGSMIYKIKDPILGNGTLNLIVLARTDGEGTIIKARAEGTDKDLELFWAFGGATGRKFSREGDIGADPESSFYLKPDYCRDNIYTISKNTFNLQYGFGRALSEEERYEIQHFPDKAKDKGIAIEKQRQLQGVFPQGSALKLGDANRQESPLILAATSATAQPLVSGRLKPAAATDYYFLVQNAGETPKYTELAAVFSAAEQARLKLASRVKVSTPDPFINTLGGALAVAADGIWEDPSYLHGAVAWRMRLNAWRGAYIADPLGWHDRAKLHFKSYSKSQVLSPEIGPVVMDTALHLARSAEKMGTSVFSSGYISRNPNDNSKPHHYDMNLVFFDQMLTHFNWTGDIEFLKEMWPTIKRHLAWEKKNFDRDGDGLYDAYAAIWASDALQYSGGGVTHSSAYNYRANKLAAKLASILGDNPAPYQQEADKIHKALNSTLWMPQLGWYAEYKDLLGLKLLHPSAGVWTIYHALDSDVPNHFQAYQSLRYIDTQIPRIPITATGLPDKNYYTISTTNWQPYDWSLNNVALAEVLHTSLAYWQGGRREEAFKLWESMMVESMYLSSSPGGFEQLSFYDAIRGELYRDFADPIGMAGRSLVEGLFGIKPNALSDTLTISPGLPATWDQASLTVPDISFEFRRTGNLENYRVLPAFPKSMNLKLVLPAFRDKLKLVRVNGQAVSWKAVPSAVETPCVELNLGKEKQYLISLEWEGEEFEKISPQTVVEGAEVNVPKSKARTNVIKDTQKAFADNTGTGPETFKYGKAGNKTIFYQLKQGDFSWWAPFNVKIEKAVEFQPELRQGDLTIKIRNKGEMLSGRLILNKGKKTFSKEMTLPAASSSTVSVPFSYISSGTNTIRFESAGQVTEDEFINWDVNASAEAKWKTIDLGRYYNDAVTNIFKNKYLSPRPEGPTLQLPWQGIGNWCYPLTDANIDDSGLRSAAKNDQLILPNGVPVLTPSKAGKNIVFTSKWDNYPDSVSIPLKGKSSHAYLMMAGSTNPMQTRISNGEVLVYYKDGSFDKLELKNPENWWPIEQDYFTDGFAFTTDQPKPYRVYLKTGEVSRNFKNFTTIKGYSNFAIGGGAATILDLPLNPDKELKELKLKTLTNDVVIGLMGLTLQTR